MSLKNEKSEPAESEERRELPCFSLPESKECSSSERRGGGIRVRSGMLVDFEGVEEGMVPVGEGWQHAALPGWLLTTLSIWVAREI